MLASANAGLRAEYQANFSVSPSPSKGTYFLFKLWRQIGIYQPMDRPTEKTSTHVKGKSQEK
ncbi:MAG: hypothetical protein CM1200mP10_13980 [Candidatus Neomarinimicrobiota bacterium]|nr:MAG: hypothetical protein CM1200mP10_13980 [Candidatus Neomarinimicrobiota bacterium]